jgi:hypothetical protein
MASTLAAERPPTPSDVEDEDLRAYEIIARLISYIPEAGSRKNTKAKPKLKKETKSKEFKYIFTKSKANYVNLLQTILDKHHVSDSVGKVSERRVYPCKVQVPPTMYLMTHESFFSIICSRFLKPVLLQSKGCIRYRGL